MLQIQEMLEESTCIRYKKLCHGSEKMVRLRRRWTKKMNTKLKGLRISGRRKLNWKAFFVVVWSRKVVKIYGDIIDRIMKIDGVYPGILFSCQLGFPVLSHPTAKCRRNALSFQNKPPYSSSVWTKLIMGPMVCNKLLVLMLVVATISCNLISADHDLLQDVCVADLASPVKVNGYPCREQFTADDFFFNGLAMPGIINTSMGSIVTAASVQKIPGLNALGISMARVDYAPGGLNPPHLHPRASETAYVLVGEVEVGFITTKNVFVSKIIKQGEMFVFPKGLIHYQKNNQMVPAAILVSFNSQFPGTQPIAPALFSATPPVPDYVLNKALQIETAEVEKIKAKFAPKVPA